MRRVIDFSVALLYETLCLNVKSSECQFEWNRAPIAEALLKHFISAGQEFQGRRN